MRWIDCSCLAGAPQVRAPRYSLFLSCLCRVRRSFAFSFADEDAVPATRPDACHLLIVEECEPCEFCNVVGMAQTKLPGVIAATSVYALVGEGNRMCAATSDVEYVNLIIVKVDHGKTSRARHGGGARALAVAVTSSHVQTAFGRYDAGV